MVFLFLGGLPGGNSHFSTATNLPADTPDGWGAIDMTTGKLYLRESSAWVEHTNPAYQSAGGGGGGSAIGQLAARVWRSATMTNIGASYKDIYSGAAFDEEHLAWIDFTGATHFRIVFIWDYVGAGTQQVRWADKDDNSNVLWESGTFNADQDPATSGWIAIPAAFVNATKKIEWQGKSTTATDDPIAKGYAIYLK